MKKIISLLLLFFLIVSSTNAFAAKDDATASDVELDIQSITCEPPNLRKSNITFDIPEDMDINLTGLSDLNISGSGQFSKKGLKTITNYIGTEYDLYDIDLRLEPHGFINEDPINWPRERIPKDSTLEEINNIEKNKLFSIPLNSEITYKNVGCKTIIAKSVENEEKFSQDNLYKYIRFPVPDGETPTEKITEDFINFANNRPQNSWFHFHCKEGIGRTTTFMIMYDIVKNKNNVSLEDIISRQVLLCGMQKDEINGFLTKERLSFFESFYARN